MTNDLSSNSFKILKSKSLIPVKFILILFKIFNLILLKNGILTNRFFILNCVRIRFAGINGALQVLQLIIEFVIEIIFGIGN